MVLRSTECGRKGWEGFHKFSIVDPCKQDIVSIENMRCSLPKMIKDCIYLCRLVQKRPHYRARFGWSPNLSPMGLRGKREEGSDGRREESGIEEYKKEWRARGRKEEREARNTSEPNLLKRALTTSTPKIDLRGLISFKVVSLAQKFKPS